MARKLVTTSAAVEDKHDPYVEIEGYGKRGYVARVYEWGNDGWYAYKYQVAYRKYFWYGRERAEAWAKRKLAKAKRVADHEKYSQRITIN